ncbi:superoxide dismutase family protein [Flavobacterium sp.]|jgi:Cu-Zn family superoxide dismutase|uniref:superoxide dismutase family protein n=1 Tax=Flavobacterium sp. TaxID=239 RepID=UPI0037BED099
MKRTITALVLFGLIILGCKSSSSNTGSTLKLVFETKSNSGVTGTAAFTQKNNEVTLVAKLAGLKPGEHAIHIHEKADCSAADAASAGGHWNPTFKKHGKWGDIEHHKGDIGNFLADEKGNATITFKTDEWCIRCGDETKDIVNKGLIVHEKPDDFITQPTGAAGARVACTAIIK